MGRLVRILKDDKNNLYSAYQVDCGEIKYSLVEETNLVYDCRTKVIYYNYESNKETLARVGFMAPYISENGKFCRFVDGKIIEIG